MPLLESRKEVLSKYGPYVRSLAAQVRKQFSTQLEMEELIAYGQVGLLEAAERFDAKVGSNFLTFAHYRIKGAIFDGLRKMGVLKGPDARAIATADRANSYLGNLADRDSGGGRSASDDVRELSSAVVGLALVFSTSLEGTEGLQLAEEQVPADERLELEQMKVRVKAAIDKLPEKERKLLQGYYFENKTLEQAGAEIGQSKSWASRLHARAIEQLKEMLEKEERGPALNRDEFEDSSRRQNDGSTLGRNDSSAGRRKGSSWAGGESPQAGSEQVRPGTEGELPRVGSGQSGTGSGGAGSTS